MKLDDFLAKCPRCGTKLSFDMTGCDCCPKCWGEFREKNDYESIADLSMRIMDELDTRQLIIPKKKLEELKLLIQSSCQKVNKDE